MTCLHPITPSNRVGWNLSALVPCGRCAACRVNRAEDWKNRMVWESDYFEDVSFVTLTYDDDHLPLDRSVDKRELQLFFKRLRKDLGKRKIKYFACGEYGEQGGRPHYHAVIFGINSVIDSECVRQNWGKGNVSLSIFKAERARYVSGYLLKEVDSSVDLTGCTKPFALMSKKIGKAFALSNKDRILNSEKPLTVQGKPVALPRYFRKLLDVKGIDSEFLVEQRKIHLQRIGGWKNPLSVFELDESFKAVREQVGLNLMGKESVKRGPENGC